MADIIKVLADIKDFTAANAGVSLPWTEPATADVVYVENPTKSFYLLVNNTSATNTPLLTIETPSTTDALEVAVDDYTHTCAVSSMIQLGPFKPSLFNTPSDDPVAAGSVKITVSGTLATGELQMALVAVK